MTKKARKHENMLLLEAGRRCIFVHRYSWSHADRRRLTRRMCKDGLLVLIEQTHDGFLYRAAKTENRPKPVLYSTASWSAGNPARHPRLTDPATRPAAQQDTQPITHAHLSKE